MSTVLHADLSHFIEQGMFDQTIELFKTLGDKQRTGLRSLVKKLVKYYSEYEQEEGTNRWSSRGTPEQWRVLHIASLFCFSKRDIKRMRTWGYKIQDVERLLDFYVPEGFGEILNEDAQDEQLRYGITYPWMLSLRDRGILDPIPEMIVRTLLKLPEPEGLRLYQNGYDMDNLREYPEILGGHIWLLFHYPSNINFHRCRTEKGEDETWVDIFLHLVERKDIDRGRLLSECLSALNQGFNKLLSGWMVDLFESLNPTKEELLEMQADINATFSCGQSKALSRLLRLYKGICAEDDFDRDGFLDNCPLLLGSETQTVINGTLAVLEGLAKRHPDRALEICGIVADLFANKKATIQVKVAKLIAKHSPAEVDEELKGTLEPFAQEICGDARNILSAYFSEEIEALPEEGNGVLPSSLSDENRIEYPDDIDSFVFFLSQAFDNHTPYHVDVFMESLLRFYPLLKAKDLPALGPALQRAHKVGGDFVNSRIGYCDKFMAYSFIDYTKMLCERFADDANALERINKKNDDPNDKEKGGWRFTLEYLKFSQEHPYLKIYRKRMLEMLTFVREETYLPLLSSPTHKPSWLEPAVLIDRIKLWQKAGKDIGQMDLETAMARTYPERSEALVERAGKELEGQASRLLAYLFSPEEKDGDIVKKGGAWSTVTITRSEPEIRAYEFGVEVRRYNTWNAQTKTHEMKPYEYKILKLAGVKHGYDGKKTNLPFKEKSSDVFYSALGLSRGDLYTLEADTERYLTLAPNRREELMATLVIALFRYSDLTGEASESRIAQRIADQMLTYANEPIKGADLLFLAGIMTCPDKTLRAMAVAIWERAVYYELIDDGAFGQVLGAFYAAEFIPLKRFTDLLSSSMLHLSAEKNIALGNTLRVMLANLEDKPVKGLKALLEIYREFPRKEADEVLNEKFAVWNKTASLRKVLKALTEQEPVQI
ncbi:hypothetical protein FUAX_18060 [Fulvitalea axinellae]|uniref:Uncharacterized protein n=1 Tax=Fulvitalea axinellae TaxID=1182444 RepID=A0AAU9CB94_9BACT|nr:hypothetical protein FUAX_18060 [Fulvitalea axinellae]